MFRWYLKKAIRRGGLVLVEPGGRVTRLGDASNGAPVILRVHDRATMLRLSLNPELAFGEAYMDGRLTTENGTIRDVLDIIMAGIALTPLPWAQLTRPFRPLYRPIQQYNPIGRSRRNVAHHYDLSDELYALFLDADLQYSCAYFPDPHMSIDAAQEAKKRHIASKLLLEPGMRVLDIGSGWGGLALTIGQIPGVAVTGLTLSERQHKVATERARALGLEDRVRFHLRDYRDETATYDRIVSVGMFEHVGVNHYRAFFEAAKRLLNPNGVMLLHAIGRRDGPGRTPAWIRKYIFPGGYAPALSEVLPVVEQQGLWVTDIEILRTHYALTLMHWQAKFAAHRPRIAELYDERFCRMWEFYLAAAEMDFRHLGGMVFQMQIAKSIGAVPLTRDYILDWERAQKGDSEQRARRTG